jgi:predicted Ser/Thr protein kinase
VIYGGFENWRVKGIRGLRLGEPEDGLTAEVVILNTDTREVLRLGGVWDGEEWVSRIISTETDSDRTDAAKKGKGKGRAKPKCTKGQPCGGSCISRTKNCRIKPKGAAKEALNRAVKAATPKTPANAGGGIPTLGQVKAMRQVGEGYFGSVAISTDGKTAYKWMKNDAGSNKPYKIDKDEIDNIKVASATGVGPKFIGVNRGRTVLAMEFLDGYTQLKDRPQFDSLPASDQKTVAKNVITQAKKLHNEGLTHSDFHMGNILFNPKDLSVRVVDYGLSEVSKRGPGDPLYDFSTLAYVGERTSHPIFGSKKFIDVIDNYDDVPSRNIYEELLRAIDDT